MEQREKLIEILSRFHECLYDETMDCNECDYKDIGECCDTRLADYLIANGVVVLPCKVGDTVYRIVDMSHTAYNSFLSVATVRSVNPTYVNLMGGLTELPMEQFGKTVFLTREEAERALEKRKGGDE